MSDIYRLPNTQERAAICKKIAQDCHSLLTKHHYIKIGTTYLRIIGDYLLQSLSIACPSGCHPYIFFNILPLYDFRMFLWYDFKQIRSVIGLSGITPEETLVVSADPIYHSFLSDCFVQYDHAIQKELDFLENQFLPLADTWVDAPSCLNYYSSHRIRNQRLTFELPLLLRSHQYQEAKPLLESQANHTISYLKKLDKAIEEGLWTAEAAAPGILEKEKELEKCKSLINAIENDDSAFIDSILWEALALSKDKVEKISKKLARTIKL